MGRVSALGLVVRPVSGEGAACAGADTELREAFFSTDPVQVAAARRVCGSCPVQLRCLAGALARDEPCGVWGGWLFTPRIVEATVIRIAVSAAVSRGTGRGRHRGAVRGGWEVWTTDVVGERQCRGGFATEAAARIAADGWAQEGRWRSDIGRRFARMLRELADDERHAVQATDHDADHATDHDADRDADRDGVGMGWAAA